MVLERLFGTPLAKIPKWIRIAGTFLTTNFLWVLFRADSFESAFRVYRAMFCFHNSGYADISALAQDGIISFPVMANCAFIFLLLPALFVVVFRGAEKIDCSENLKLTRKNAAFAAFSFALALMCMGRESVFIYFNF